MAQKNQITATALHSFIYTEKVGNEKFNHKRNISAYNEVFDIFMSLMVQKNKKPKLLRFGLFVPRTGFEPAHLAALLPESSASTNFAIWALRGLKFQV